MCIMVFDNSVTFQILDIVDPNLFIAKKDIQGSFSVKLLLKPYPELQSNQHQHVVDVYIGRPMAGTI